MTAGDGALRPACPVMHRSGAAAIRQQDDDSITFQTVATSSLQSLRRAAGAAQVDSDEPRWRVAILHTSSMTSYVRHSAAATSCRVSLEPASFITGRLIRLSENRIFKKRNHKKV